MNKEVVSVLESKNGSIIAEDVVNNKGVLIVATNTECNAYIKSKLIEHGIVNITIFDHRVNHNNNKLDLEYLKQEYHKSLVLVKEILYDLVTEKGFNIEKVETIYDIINNNSKDVSNIVPVIQLLQTTDEYTYTHSVNTAFYSMLLAKWLKLGEADIRKVTIAGLLHDIGKLKIPGNILNKAGKLTEEEYEIIKQHTILGYNMLSEIQDLDREIIRAVLFHHERYDRSGYPLSVSFENIGLYTKIIAIADVYDAMTSDRVYKKRTTLFSAIEMFKSVGTSKYDVAVLNTFIHNIVIYFVGVRVELSNGAIGTIVYIPPHDVLNPIIQIDKDKNYYELSKLKCFIVSILGK